MDKLNLKDIVSGDCDYIDLMEIYSNSENKLKIIGNKYVCFDDALKMLFANSGISVVGEINKVRELNYDFYNTLIGCGYGDYLSTLELCQDEQLYRCQTFCVYNGKEPAQALLLANIQYDCMEADYSEYSYKKVYGYNIREFAYELYKQDWLNAYTDKNMRLDAIKSYYSYRKECAEEGVPADSYNEWIMDFGFGSNCYVCFDEFCDNEYLDEDFISSLLDNPELITTYKEDLREFSEM